MTEKKIQEKYIEFQIYQQQMEQLSKYAEELEAKRAELIRTEEALGELQNSKQGTELMIPIADGIFMKSKLEASNEFIVSVGAGTAATKTRDQVHGLINLQLQELVVAQRKLSDKVATIQMRMMELAEEVEKLSG